jgi:hypothetical protein
MDLEKLKKTWDKIPGETELNENQLKSMLGKKTKNLIERIDSNIRIGLWILVLLIAFFVIDDFVVSPEIAKTFVHDLTLPAWIQFLSIFSYALIISTFIFFVLRYFKIKRTSNYTSNLHDTLVQTIDTLMLYKRMFYMVLLALFITFSSMFVAGLYEGIALKARETGVSFNEISKGNLFVTLSGGILVFLSIISGFLYFLHWGFKKLYGKYISKLKSALAELLELEE